MRLARKGLVRCGSTSLVAQGFRPRLGSPAGDSFATLAFSIRRSRTLAGFCRSLAFARRRQLDARSSRLGKSNGNRLFGGARAVLPLTNMMHFFAHKLAGLG
jgi:hypothetical protein